jgi:hypothetical protein
MEEHYDQINITNTMIKPNTTNTMIKIGTILKTNTTIS